MTEVSTFRATLIFFDKIGIYDVVLPFLLVFTIVFAIFEKTRVLGTEEINGKTYTKKNLNSMTAFVIAFMVIASARLVEIITTVSANMVVLLLLSVMFLLLVGSFWKEGEVFLDKDSAWFKLFMGIMFVGIVFIFLNALGWDITIWIWLMQFYSSTAVSSVILVIVILIIMFYITMGESRGTKKGED